MKAQDDISIYLSGERLYGDDFTQDEIDAWFADEREGYANLKSSSDKLYKYSYHELNRMHGYKYLNQERIEKVLGLGSAYGDEFIPISKRISKITIVDPSEKFSKTIDIDGIPCEYIKPNPNGNLPFRENYFDLITCFGVLHHIPNVSHVLSECYRCLKKDGTLLLREPIVSMGDWREPRNGLTKRERGIPVELFKNILCDTGFIIKRKTPCIFPLIPKLVGRLGVETYNSYALTLLDRLLSKLFFWNVKYHRIAIYEKVAPASVFFVLEKTTAK